MTGYTAELCEGEERAPAEGAAQDAGEDTDRDAGEDTGEVEAVPSHIILSEN